MKHWGLLVLSLHALSCLVSGVTSGRTSSYVRTAFPSTDIPLEREKKGGSCSQRYEYLDRIIRRRFQPNTFKFVASKVAADGFLFGLLDLLMFFSYVGLGQGRSVEQVKEDVKRDFILALVVGGTIWPVVHIANFCFPVRYQLLYVNVFCLFDSCCLS